MKMKQIAVAVGAVMLAGSAAAEFSANIGVTSNYMWRGFTQTDNDAAISGGIDFAHDSGFYVGTWVSNVDFPETVTAGGTDTEQSDNGTEVDLYGGFGGEFGSGFGYDVGVIGYFYPTYDESDFVEIYGSLSYSFLTGGIYYTVDTDAGGDDDHIYYYLQAGTEIAPTWSVGGTAGYYDLDGDADEVTHFQLDVTKSAGDLGDFTMSVSYAEDTGDSNEEDAVFFVSWSKTFE